jgi:catechol 2,3-dioxygenase-like lactoylglutathione lyase family enzyme
MNEEIYPMPMFPMLIVNDLEVSSDFYQNALGFKHIFTMPGTGGQPALVHLRWVKYADLLIARPSDGKELMGPRGVGISLNFNLFDHFNGDMDARHARENSVTIIGPIDQPWNVREVTAFDPDGYKLIFTTPLNANLPFEKVIKQASRGE